MTDAQRQALYAQMREQAYRQAAQKMGRSRVGPQGNWTIELKKGADGVWEMQR